MDNRIREVMEILISAEGATLAERYNLHFKEEISFWGNRLLQFNLTKKLIAITMKIIEDTYCFNFSHSESDNKNDIPKLQSHNKTWDVFHCFNHYYSKNKQSMFEKLKHEELCQIRLIEIFGLIFFYLTARYILTPKDADYEKGFWIKTITLASTMARRDKWSEDELTTNWNEKREFPQPETAEFAYRELYQWATAQIAYEHYKNAVKAHKKFLNQHQCSYKYTIKYYEENKSNKSYFFQSNKKLNHTKMATQIFEDLDSNNFFKDGVKLAVDTGVETICGWLKDHKNGVNKLNYQPTISSKKIRKIIKDPILERKPKKSAKIVLMERTK